MTVLDIIDEALSQRAEADLRITGEYLDAFRAMTLADKKTAFLALGDNQRRELLGFFSTAELQAIKAKLSA